MPRGPPRNQKNRHELILDPALNAQVEKFHAAASARFPNRPVVDSIRELIRAGLTLAYENGVTAALRVIGTQRIRMEAMREFGRFAMELGQRYEAKSTDMEQRIHGDAVLAAMEAEDARRERIEAGNEFPWRNVEDVLDGNQR